jgi:hypothetical protein
MALFTHNNANVFWLNSRRKNYYYGIEMWNCWITECWKIDLV